jgi:hypothetical protein
MAGSNPPRGDRVVEVRGRGKARTNWLPVNGAEALPSCIGVQRGVFKGVEDSRRPPALHVGNS